MLKRTLTFEDFNGEERTEDWYFHLNEAEVMQWISTSGDYTLDAKLQEIAKERNGRAVMDTFEDLIRRSVGKKSLDGRQFIKNKEITDSFMQSGAYPVLFMELVTDAKAAADFVNGIIPKKLHDKVVDMQNQMLPGA